ncbi:MAG: DoxX family protein [Comamonas sp.]
MLSTLLQSRAYYTLATALLTYIFWWSGLSKIFDFAGAMAEMVHFGLRPAALFAAATIALQVLGSLAIISASRWAWLGAGALAVFTLSTIPLAHRFWEMEGMVAFLEKALVQEHISLIGGLAVAAALASMRRKAAVIQ